MVQRSTQKTPVLLIAETRPTVAAGFKVFLANLPDAQPVAIMTGLDHVIAYAERHEIGLIIVGEGMNGATPLSEFRRLRQSNPSWRLALLTELTDRETIIAGLSAGASGIIPTSVEEGELLEAVTRMLAGSIYVPNMTALIEQPPALGPSPGSASVTPTPLTPRQFEVLGVLAQGNSNKEIARILAISDSTVSMHLNAAFTALGVHDRTSAASAYRNMVYPDGGTQSHWSSERRHSGFGSRMFS